jgi:hypothetical protein
LPSIWVPSAMRLLIGGCFFLLNMGIPSVDFTT